eukprot:2622948-Pleurochrysis_carterae.AAC.1
MQESINHIAAVDHATTCDELINCSLHTVVDRRGGAVDPLTIIRLKVLMTVRQAWQALAPTAEPCL